MTKSSSSFPELLFSDLNEDEKSTCLLMVKFLRVIAALRDPVSGCPWDLEQTHESLRSYLIEETFEAVEAIDGGEIKNLSGELGDVLLQVVLHSQLGKESGAFNFGAVIEGVTEKMIRRHPHVFGAGTCDSPQSVLENWEKIKHKENEGQKSKDENSISERITKLPKGLPALLGTERIGEKAARWGFDWESINQVIEKVEEEIAELKEALTPIATQTPELRKPLGAAAPTHAIDRIRAGEEIGDALFTLTQLARWLGLSGEDLLRGTMARFKSRLEIMVKNIPGDFSSASRRDKEAAWDSAKEELKN